MANIFSERTEQASREIPEKSTKKVESGYNEQRFSNSSPAHWAQPQNVAAEYENYKNDDNYQSQFITREQANVAYDYMNARNGGRPIEQWKPLNNDDQFLNEVASDWKTPANVPTWTEQKASQQQSRMITSNADYIQRGSEPSPSPKPSSSHTETYREKIINEPYTPTNKAVQEMASVTENENGYNDLGLKGKIAYNILPGSSIADAPKSSEWTKPILNSALAASGGAIVGELTGTALGGLLFGPPGALAGKEIGKIGGGLTTFGLMYLQQKTGINIPIINDVLEKFDAAADWVEGTQARLGTARELATGRKGTGDLSDILNVINDYVTSGSDILDTYKELGGKYSKEAFEIVGPLANEIGATPLEGWTSRAIINTPEVIKAAAEGHGIKAIIEGKGVDKSKTAELGETYRYNLGYDTPQEMSEGTYGHEAFVNLLETADEMLNRGYDKDTVEAYLSNVVNNYYGTSGYVSDLTLQSVFDPMNALDGIAGNVVSEIGNITGDVQLQKAGQVNKGNIVMDLTPDILAPVVEQAGKAFGQEWHKSNGINQIVDTYKSEVIASPLSETTRFGRAVAGINPDGTLRDFSPNTTGGIKNRIANFFGRTDESKALAEGSVSWDFIDTMLENAMNTDNDQAAIANVHDTIMQIETPDNIDVNNPMYGLTQTALFNSVKDDIAMAVSSSEEAINSVINTWEKNRVIVSNIQLLASAIGFKDIEKFVSQYQNKRAQFDQIVRNKFQQGNGEITASDGTKITEADYYAVLDDTMKRYTDKTLLYGNDKFTVQRIKNAVSDSMNKVLIDKYNIKQPDKFIYRFGNLVKKSQNLLLLGLSPSYLVNNVLNNAITRQAVGVGGFMTDGQIGRFANRFGIEPSRFGEINVETGDSKPLKNQTGYNRLQSAIFDAKKNNDWVDNFTEYIGKKTKGISIFSKFANDVEQSETKQAMYAGMKIYLDKTWNTKQNIRKMPAALENAIEAVIPGMTEKIYSAVSRSMNADEIQKNVFGDYIPPNVRDIVSAVQNETHFVGFDEKILTEIFDNYGIADILQAALDGKNPEERHQAFRDVYDYIHGLSIEYRMEDLKARAEQVQTQLINEGFVSAIDIMQDLSQANIDFWLNNTNEYSRLYNRQIDILSQTNPRWKDLITDLHNEQNRQWLSLYDESAEIYNGIVQGLGFDDQHKEAYIKCVKEMQENWKAFYDKQNDAFIVFDNATGKDRVLAWKKYLEVMDYAYAEHSANELNIQERMDQAMMDGLSESSGVTDMTEISNRFAELRKLRGDMFEMNNECREVTRLIYGEENPNYQSMEQRQALWNDFNKKLQEKKIEIFEKTKELYTAMRPLQENAIEKRKDNFIGYDKAMTLKREYGVEKKLIGNADRLEYVTIDQPYSAGPKRKSDGKPIYKIIGYIVNNDTNDIIGLTAETMGDTKLNDGVKTYDIIGLDIRDNTYQTYLYVDPDTKNIYRETGTMNPGNDDAFRDYSAYAPHSPVGSTPTSSPEGGGNAQLFEQVVLPLFDTIEQKYDEALLEAQKAGGLNKLDSDTVRQIREYLDYSVAQDLTNTKFKAVRYGEMMRDLALLNYSDRNGFDNLLTLIAPYQFWMTRSAVNWAKRMIDRPNLYANYTRYKELEERNKKYFEPSRNDGKIGIPVPFLPSWMGDTVWINPFSQGYPFAQFIEPLEEYDSAKHILEQQTRTNLEQMYTDNEMSFDEYQDALNNKSGQYWDIAYAKAQTENDVDSDLGNLFQQYFGFSLPVSWMIKIAQGKGDEISSTPMSRFGQTTGSLVENIGGNVAGKIGKGINETLTAPEKAMRKLFHLEWNEYGQFGDYLLRRQVAEMCADGDITYNEALTAMAEKDGNAIWEKAAERQRKENILKTQGAGTIYALEEGIRGYHNGTMTAREALSGVGIELLASLYPQSVYTSGEQKLRLLDREKNNVLSSGDKKAIAQFYDEHPEKSVQSISYIDDDEQLLRKVLYQSITDNFYSMNNYMKEDVKQSLGHKFVDGILEKETLAYQTMPLEELAGYAQSLNGSIPNVPQSVIDRTKVRVDRIDYTRPETIRKMEDWDKYVDTKYPGIKTIQSYYYSLPQSQRKAFIRNFPELPDYWNDKNAFEENNRDVMTYKETKNDFANEALAMKVLPEMSRYTQKEMQYHLQTKEPLPDWAEYEINELRKEYDPDSDIEYFMSKIADY